MKSNRNILHIGFEIGILSKGINAVIEIICAFLLMFFNPVRLNNLMTWLTYPELLEDPNDKIMNFVLRIAGNYSVSSQHFGIFYLLSHGIVKLFLVIMLWRKKLWAYPLTVVALMFFIAYQIYRYSYSPSSFLIALTIFDIAMIFLTISEYKRIKTYL